MINWIMGNINSDFINLLTLLALVIGGIFALKQWHESCKCSRAEYVNSLIEKLRNDDEIRDIMYKIDYNEVWYNESYHSTFNSNDSKREFEKKVDKTLSYFSYICYLYSIGLLKAKEFKFFEFELNRIADDFSVQAYLHNLYHFSNKRNTQLPFIYLIEHFKEKNLVPKIVWDANTKEYPKYLDY